MKARMFFFEKKNQKTFVPWRCRFIIGRAPKNKSLLLLFFRKEDLACFSGFV
jgi:hypothetical protein